MQIPFATDQRFPEVGINFFAVMCSLVVFVTASFAPAILKKLILFMDRNIDYELKLPVTVRGSMQMSLSLDG